MKALLISLFRRDSSDSLIDDSIIYEDLESLASLESDLIDMDVIDSDF